MIDEYIKFSGVPLPIYTTSLLPIGTSVKKTITIPISKNLRTFRNYLPDRNMHKGIIKEDWPNDYIFVDD